MMPLDAQQLKLYFHTEFHWMKVKVKVSRDERG
jgi:hypothetical protein